MKKWFILFLTFVLIGCTLQPTHSLKGYSLEEMNLDLINLDHIEFKYPNGPYKLKSLFQAEHRTDPSKNGNYSIVYLYFLDENRQINKIPVKYILGVKQSDIQSGRDTVNFDSNTYSLADLEENVVYKDNTWIVYDVSAYGDGKDGKRHHLL